MALLDGALLALALAAHPLGSAPGQPIRTGAKGTPAPHPDLPATRIRSLHADGGAGSRHAFPP
jgi:hypothetical protein